MDCSETPAQSCAALTVLHFPVKAHWKFIYLLSELLFSDMFFSVEEPNKRYQRKKEGWRLLPRYCRRRHWWVMKVEDKRACVFQRIYFLKHLSSHDAHGAEAFFSASGYSNLSNSHCQWRVCSFCCCFPLPSGLCCGLLRAWCFKRQVWGFCWRPERREKCSCPKPERSSALEAADS